MLLSKCLRKLNHLAKKKITLPESDKKLEGVFEFKKNKIGEYVWLSPYRGSITWNCNAMTQCQCFFGLTSL
jgi:hypothetical protein